MNTQRVCDEYPMNIQKPQRGFTLIEVLVTMLIMGILMAIGTLTYFSAQRSGRDSKRQADLRKIQNALELHYGDNHVYPSSPGVWVAAGMLEAPLVTGGRKYVDELPLDPSSGSSYFYYTFNGDTCYCLSAGVERLGNAQADGECGGSGYTSSHGTDGYYVMCP